MAASPDDAVRVVRERLDAQAAEEKRAQRTELLSRAVVVIAVTILLAILGGGVWLGVSIRNTQLEGTPTGQKLLASADRLLDCTDPGNPDTGTPAGKCFTDAQARTAEAVGAITDNSLRASAAIAYCQSRGILDYKPLLKCAVRLVSTRNPKP